MISKLEIEMSKPGKVACTPSIWKMETGGPGVQGQPWLHGVLEAGLN